MTKTQVKSDSIISDLEEPISLSELQRRIDYISKEYNNPMIKIEESTVGYNTYTRLIMIDSNENRG